MWSTGGVLVKTLTGPQFGLAPQSLVCLRSLTAGLVLVWALPRITAAPLRPVAGASLAYTSMVICFVTSTTNTTAANAIFLEYFNPLLVAMWAYAMGTEQARRSTLTALALGTAGVVVIMVGSWNPANRAGIGLGLGCALSSATFTLIQRNIREGSSVAQISLYNLIAAAIVLPFALGKFSTISLPALGLVALMGTFQLGVPFVLFVKGLRRVPVVEAALITLMEPVLNPIWVWLFYHERPSPWTLVGGAAILSALVIHILTHPGSEEEQPAAPEPALQSGN